MPHLLQTTEIATEVNYHRRRRGRACEEHLSLLSVVGGVGYNSTGLMEGLAHQTHLQHVNDDGKEVTFAPPTLPRCPSHFDSLPHTHQTTLDHPTVLFDIATQYKRDIPYTKDGTTTTQNKWPLASHTNTTVADKPSSHLATTGHAHTHPRPNGGQLSARPCALRLCIKAISDSKDRTEWRRERVVS